MTRQDPAMVQSNFERRPGDRYWTEPWVTRALLRSVFGRRLAELGSTVWEPACGRGDIVQELTEHNYDVFASDVDMSDFDKASEWITSEQRDFLDLDSLLDPPDDAITAIVTNPPYGNRVAPFIRRALEHDVEFVAMVLRSEFIHGSGKRDGRDEFLEMDEFAGVVALTARPRWDDWKNKPSPDNGPRHNYSWYVWDRFTVGNPPIVVREGRS